MTLLHIVIVALIQGITEFLPISSSAHLILVPAVTGWTDQGLVLDVAVHVGTLGAVIVYFWRDLWAMAKGLALLAAGRPTIEASLVGKLAIATVPVVIAGYLVHEFAPTLFRGVEVIAWATIGFGILLYIADRRAMTLRRLDHLTFGYAVVVGLSQALALIPGTSRSGITMTAARLLGFERTDAARLSLLMSIPVIIAAGTLSGLDLYRAGDPTLTVQAAVAALLAFVAALLAIAAMMAWLRRLTFTPFVVYRVVLGVILLIWVYVYDAQPFTPIAGG
ncbi:MAG: undecaprenyl-diphosphate phosphatase [Alphaproteobacteria bacterium]|nr:undecaprenyl-diphosphate phosphatase [Alphaproteobacteria bacterium]